MGTCWNCGTQLSLQEGQTNCDNCKAVVYYKCNSCKEGFEVADEKGKKLPECSLCGYFYCPHCSVCSWSCIKYDWEKQILKILAPEITQGNFPILLSKVRQITKYIEKVKTSNERKECIHSIPITYAKGRIKGLFAKVDGFKVKNEADRKKFIKRIDEITNLNLGEKITITQAREEGSYGQEYRDAFNLLVCLGKFKIIEMPKIEDKPAYQLYERVEGEPCRYLDIQELIFNECPKCKKHYDLNLTHCQNCILKKGKHKGENFKLKKRLNNKDTCQMYRGDFHGKS